MLDLLLAALVVALTSILAYTFGLRTARVGSKVVRGFLLAAVVAVTVLYTVTLWDRPVLASLLPHSSLIVLGNIFPLTSAFLLGVYSRRTSIGLPRRAAISVLCAGVATYSIGWPMLGAPPECGKLETPDGQVFQTTGSTCSPACAATLLRMHGIDATEQEMAELCLTRGGTHWQGLYRGLCMKTEQTNWNVVVSEVDPLDTSWIDDRPGILSVGVRTDIPNRNRVCRELGFFAEQEHSVVLLGPTATRGIRVFDPSPEFGDETWSPRVLQQLRVGCLIHLERRQQSLPGDAIVADIEPPKR